MIIFWLKVVLVPLLLIMHLTCTDVWQHEGKSIKTAGKSQSEDFMPHLNQFCKNHKRKRNKARWLFCWRMFPLKCIYFGVTTQTHYVTWGHPCLPVLSDILRFQSRTDVDVSGLKLKRWSTVAFSGRLCYVKVSDASLWLIRQPAANLLVNSSTLRLLSPSTIPSVWAPPPPPHMALRARSPVDFNKILCPTVCLLTRDQFPWQQRIL